MGRKRIIPFKLEGQEIIYVEVTADETEDTDIGVPRGEGKVTERVIADIEGVISQIPKVANLLLNLLKEINSPEEISIEFGIKIKGNANIIIASAESNALFKVHLKWKNK